MRKFHREKSDRRSFIEGLVHNLVLHNKIQTTITRAKAIRPVTEKLVTLGKKQTLAAHRLLLQRLPEESAHKIFYDIAPKYKDTKGGYLRIRKLSGYRKRDAAEKAVIEFI